MLAPYQQVSTNRCLGKEKKTQPPYLSLYYQNHQQGLSTKKKSHYLNQKPLLWIALFTCKKPYCVTCSQYGIKETEYKFCGEDCSVKYWLSIYAKVYGKKENSPHTRVDIFNSPIAPDGSLHARSKNLFLGGGAGGRSIRQLFSNSFPKNLNQEERQKRKDQPWRRLATKDKVAQTAGFNLPAYREQRSIEELLEQYGEFSYLTGKPLGNYYLSTLDIDLKKAEFAEKLVARLEKNVNCLLGSLRVSYDKTKKGLHIDILTPEPLPNEIIYYRGWGKLWNVGSIQSQGKYVVGEDKDKEFVKNGKWYWKVDRNEEVGAKLAKFFFVLGKTQQVAKRSVNPSLNSKKINQIVQRTKQILQAKVLSVKKTCLDDFLRVFYLSQKTQKTGYFLLNTYQKPDILPNLTVGSVHSMLLIDGQKHSFFSRLNFLSLKLKSICRKKLDLFVKEVKETLADKAF